MKKYTKALAILLAVLLLPVGTAFAFTDPAAALSPLYGDGMLFKQNSEAVFTGTCKNGASVTAELLAPGGEIVNKAGTTASKSGTFTLTMSTPAGSYTEYSIVFYEDGVPFRTLRDVVFGELWLASGQSNMQYGLASAEGGKQMFEARTPLSKWLRAFLVPAISTYRGSSVRFPAEPQNEIEGAVWVKGDDMNFYNVSAVAYYFAAKLQEELGVPVGILNSSLGGSCISSWLSREAIENDEAVRNDYISLGKYISAEDWVRSDRDQYSDMSANYVLKTHALRNFRISGMIWYQGETNIMMQWTHKEYTHSFDLLQRSYTEEFSYEDGLLPIVFTSLAAYPYFGGTELCDMNREFIEIQQAQPESRALTSIYDVPLDYFDELGSIHPAYKQPVGEKMAYAAMGMVYEPNDTYTTATVSQTEIRDGSIYVTLRNTGSGLVCGGDKLFGFTIAGKDGVYVPADAEITSPDTVRIYSESVPEPVSATYAYAADNMNANLFASDADGELIPAGVFVTDDAPGSHHFKYTEWLDCEASSAFRVLLEGNIGYYDTWKADNAAVSFDAESAYSGTNGMRIVKTGGGKTFSVSPVIGMKENLKNVIFSDGENDFSDYGTLSFRIRNNGEKDAELSELRFYTSAGIWYSPALTGENTGAFTVPADGEWHLISFDLNTLFFDGNKGGAKYDNEKLGAIRSISFRFSSDGGADLSADEFRFAPETEEPGTRFDGAFSRFGNPFELISAFFTQFISAIVELFLSFGVSC